jgi:Mn2+/Fe2+ NRAMP family transporter
MGLIIADIGNTATEFAGVAGSMAIFGISKYISVPLAAIAVWFLVVKGDYKLSERIFLFFSVCLLSYVVSAILAKPDWGAIAVSLSHPRMNYDPATLTIILGIIGTTVAPWMQFYMQSTVMEKGIQIKDYKFAVWDVVIGCIATIVVAFFIMVACATTLHANGVVIEEAKDAALSLKPFAGAFASQLFAFGLFIASIFSATILPLATAFYVCEAFGFERGINRKLKDAPEFYFIFTSIIVIAIIIILLPNAPLIAITMWTQVINAILLPVVLISMLIMVNNKKIMGNYTNNYFQNLIGRATVAILIILTGILFTLSISSALQKIF